MSVFVLNHKTLHNLYKLIYTKCDPLKKKKKQCKGMKISFSLIKISITDWLKWGN